MLSELSSSPLSNGRDPRLFQNGRDRQTAEKGIDQKNLGSIQHERGYGRPRADLHFQATLAADEKMVLSAGGVAADAVGVRGATIWFQGRNNQGCAVMIAQHYTQVSVVMSAERLYRGESPTQIGFLTD
jgi:hypothetical protein